MKKKSKGPKPSWIYLVAAARKIWRWSPQRRIAKKESLNCAICGKVFLTDDDKEMDHVIPVGKAPRKWKGWDSYYKRLFDGPLQSLCHECHKMKTNSERIARRKANAKLCP